MDLFKKENKYANSNHISRPKRNHQEMDSDSKSTKSDHLDAKSQYRSSSSQIMADHSYSRLPSSSSPQPSSSRLSPASIERQFSSTNRTLHSSESSPHSASESSTRKDAYNGKHSSSDHQREPTNSSHRNGHGLHKVSRTSKDICKSKSSSNLVTPKKVLKGLIEVDIFSKEFQKHHSSAAASSGRGKTSQSKLSPTSDTKDVKSVNVIQSKVALNNLALTHKQSSNGGAGSIQNHRILRLSDRRDNCISPTEICPKVDLQRLKFNPLQRRPENEKEHLSTGGMDYTLRYRGGGRFTVKPDKKHKQQKENRPIVSDVPETSSMAKANGEPIKIKSNTVQVQNDHDNSKRKSNSITKTNSKSDSDSERKSKKSRSSTKKGSQLPVLQTDALRKSKIEPETVAIARSDDLGLHIHRVEPTGDHETETSRHMAPPRRMEFVQESEDQLHKKELAQLDSEEQIQPVSQSEPSREVDEHIYHAELTEKLIDNETKREQLIEPPQKMEFVQEGEHHLLKKEPTQHDSTEQSQPALSPRLAWDELKQKRKMEFERFQSKGKSLFDFTNLKSVPVDGWQMAGKSKLALVLRKNNLLFSTFLKLKPNGAAFAGVRRKVAWDLSDFEKITMRCRGLGNTRYKVVLEDDRQMSNIVFKHVFTVSISTEFMEVEVKLKNFKAFSGGREMPFEEPLNTANITSFGIQIFSGGIPDFRQAGASVLILEGINAV